MGLFIGIIFVIIFIAFILGILEYTNLSTHSKPIKECYHEAIIDKLPNYTLNRYCDRILSNGDNLLFIAKMKDSLFFYGYVNDIGLVYKNTKLANEIEKRFVELKKEPKKEPLINYFYK